MWEKQGECHHCGAPIFAKNLDQPEPKIKFTCDCRLNLNLQPANPVYIPPPIVPPAQPYGPIWEWRPWEAPYYTVTCETSAK